jgi:hypothetical protein
VPILEWLYLLRSAKLCALWTAQAFICANSLRRFCAERKVGTRLYFCADFAHFIFFVGIIFASPKQKIAESEFPFQSHL